MYNFRFTLKNYRIVFFIIILISIFILYKKNNVSFVQVFEKSKIYGLKVANKLTELDDSELPWWERKFPACGNITHDRKVINGKLYASKLDQTTKAISKKPTQGNSSTATETTPQENEFDDVQFYSAYEFWKRTKGRHNTCGWRSWNEGPEQKVISYSIYGTNSDYWSSINSLINSIKIFYPGWVVRIYMDPRGKEKDFCQVLLENPNVHVCDVKAIPAFGDMTSVHPALWRAAPLADPFIDLVAVRDSDSMIIQREVDAVNEWIPTGKVLHIMRDSIWHNIHILAGMWGINMKAGDRKTLMDIAKDTLTQGTRSQKYGHDQDVLNRSVYSKLKDNMVAHDSYLCNKFESRPFPTQRKNFTWVGNKRYIKLLAKQTYMRICPIQCRPKQHQDWLYC